jgi:hypothetical protein
MFSFRSTFVSLIGVDLVHDLLSDAYGHEMLRVVKKIGELLSYEQLAAAIPFAVGAFVA